MSEQDNGNMISSKLASLLLLITLLVVGGVIYVNAIGWLISSWAHHPFYQHGFIIVFIWLGLLAHAFYVSPNRSLRIRLLAILFLGGATVMTVVGVMVKSLHLQTLGSLFWGVGLTSLVLPYGQNSNAFLSFLLLSLTIPLPFLPYLTSLLQMMMIESVGSTLELAGYVVSTQGALVTIPTGQFIIGAPSSGIQSFLAFPTLALALLCLGRFSLFRSALFFFGSFFVAIIFNYMRILALFLVALKSDHHYAYDLFHDRGNALFFMMAFITLLVLWRNFGQYHFVLSRYLNKIRG
jgi:exosortase/archaeosortase family protein